jgi:hypothetical protein
LLPTIFLSNVAVGAKCPPYGNRRGELCSLPALLTLG